MSDVKITPLFTFAERVEIQLALGAHIVALEARLSRGFDAYGPPEERAHWEKFYRTKLETAKQAAQTIAGC